MRKSNKITLSSPHPWGCFLVQIVPRVIDAVFPTPVGVFPILDGSITVNVGLPHTRGGVSGCRTLLPEVSRSSPHPWGCFLFEDDYEKLMWVFPTPVGVFPEQDAQKQYVLCLPHTRGGVSTSITVLASFLVSSPHPWGCFPFSGVKYGQALVFPTPVGVFLSAPILMAHCPCLPHTRGGVSCAHFGGIAIISSSPHPWGCFSPIIQRRTDGVVFPTPVGVFPVRLRERVQRCRLPHTRGGVSPSSHGAYLLNTSSPHPWGCFICFLVRTCLCDVFPTPVGVFLRQ